MEIVTVRTRCNRALALAENNVQTRRAIEVIKEMWDQAQAQIVKIESCLAEDPSARCHWIIGNTSILAWRFPPTGGRLLNAWREIAGSFEEEEKDQG